MPADEAPHKPTRDFKILAPKNQPRHDPPKNSQPRSDVRHSRYARHQAWRHGQGMDRNRTRQCSKLLELLGG